MSLTGDVITYLQAIGQVDGHSWRISQGLQHREYDGFDQLVAIEDVSSVNYASETHNNSNRGLGFRLMVRAGQHAYPTAIDKFHSVFDAIQDKHLTINGTAGVGNTFHLIHSENDGPIVSWDAKKRPSMTAVFQVTVKRL